MADVTLRGHHIKNLRFALYAREHDGFLARKHNEGNSFDHILDAPPHTISIIAGSIDSVCERCNDLQSCESEGEIYSRSSKLFDKIMAYASGTKAGKTYDSSELIEKLRKQNVFSQSIRDYFGMALYLAIALPFEAMDAIKPLKNGVSVMSRVNTIVNYLTFGLFVDLMILPGLTDASLHEYLGLHFPHYADKIEQLLLGVGIVYVLKGFTKK